LSLTNPPVVLYDKGRLSPDRTRAFNNYMSNTDNYLSAFGLRNYSGHAVNFNDVDSKNDPGIWAADHVAGAFHMSLKHRNNRFYNPLRAKFIGDGHLDLWF